MLDYIHVRASTEVKNTTHFRMMVKHLRKFSGAVGKIKMNGYKAARFLFA